MRKVISIAALFLVAGLSAGSAQLLTRADEYDAKTWGDARRLWATVAKGCRDTDCHITIWADGRIWMTIKDGGADYRGQGSSPWEAAEDLIRKNDANKARVERALRPAG